MLLLAFNKEEIYYHPLEMPRKVPLRAKKSEIELKTVLEKYPTHDVDYPNCWLVYKNEKMKLDKKAQELRKQQKQEKEESMSTVEKIKQLLMAIANHIQFAKGQEAHGMVAQSEGLMRAASEKYERAKAIYGTLTSEEKGQFTEQERQALESNNVTDVEHCIERASSDEEKVPLEQLEKKYGKLEELVRDYKEKLSKRDKQVKTLQTVLMKFRKHVKDEYRDQVEESLKELEIQ